MFLILLLIFILGYANTILVYRCIFHIELTTSKLRWALLSVTVFLGCLLLFQKQNLEYIFIYELILGFFTVIVCETKKTLKVIFLSPIIQVFIYVLVSVLLVFFSLLFNIGEDGSLERANAEAMILFLQTVALTILYLLKIRKISSFHREVLPDKPLYFTLLIGSSAMIGLLIVLKYTFPTDVINSNYLKILIVFTCIFAFLFLYVCLWLHYSIQKVADMKDDQKYYLSLIKRQNIKMNDMLNADISTRRFRHDYRSHMTMLKGLLLNKDYSEAEAFLDKLSELGQNITLQSFTGIPAIDYVIEPFYQKAVSNNIRWEFNSNLTYINNIDYISLNCVLSNLLSNAINAASIENDKYVSTSIICQKYMTQIIVKNSYKGNPDTSFSFANNKRGEHGHGLINVKTAVNQKGGSLDLIGDGSSFTAIAKFSIHDN